jgi:hypothetical protein
MAGTLFGLGLSQQVDAQGVPLSGGLLYIYDANTSTPAVTYSDFALATTQTWPLEADSAGRFPAFWVTDGSYRARLTTSTGVEVFDEQSITAIGASDGGSGSGSSAQDTTTLFQTGDMLWLPISGTRSGWVRCNGRTIGSGSSGASERANGDTEALFEYFWNNFADSLCAVGGGRGASAEADFNAAKAIATLDMRSKGIFGLDTMGNSAASVTGGSSTAADAIGASTYTVAQANLPNVNLSSTALTAVITGTVPLGVETVQSGAGATVSNNSTSGASFSPTIDAAATIAGTVPLGGSGTDIDILPPVRVGTYYIKL